MRKRTLLWLIVILCVACAAVFALARIRRGFSAWKNPSSLLEVQDG